MESDPKEGAPEREAVVADPLPLPVLSSPLLEDDSDRGFSGLGDGLDV